MRDTRPNNKRTLQSGQGLYGTRQTATRPRPAPLPPRVFPLPVFLGAGAASGKPSSVPAVARRSARSPPNSGGRIPAVPASPGPAGPSCPRWAPLAGNGLRTGAPGLGAAPGSRPGARLPGKHPFTFGFQPGPAPGGQGSPRAPRPQGTAPPRPAHARGQGDTAGAGGWRAVGERANTSTN